MNKELKKLLPTLKEIQDQCDLLANDSMSSISENVIKPIGFKMGVMWLIDYLDKGKRLK